MSSPSDGIKLWTTAFKSIWTACGLVNPVARQAEKDLNSFANATTGAYLKGPAAPATFKLELRRQFDADGLAANTFENEIEGTETFYIYTNQSVGNLRGVHIKSLIKGTCPLKAPWIDAAGALATAVFLTVAFPDGVRDPVWLAIKDAVIAAGLDRILKPNALAEAEKDLVLANKTVDDLMTDLSRI